MYFHAQEYVLLTFLRSLGLDLPCEFTFKRIACVLMMVREDWDVVLSKTEETKKQEVALCKKHWHIQSRRASDKPTAVVQVLPALPHEFRGHYPQLWANAYGDGPGPVEPRICTRQLELLDMSFKARGRASDPVPTPQLSLQTPSLSLAPEVQLPNALTQMGNMMLQGMQHMANQQSKMMEMMMGSSANASRCPNGLRGIISSSGPRWSTPARQAALTDLTSPESPQKAAAEAAPRLAAEATRAAHAAAAQAAALAEKAAEAGEAAIAEEWARGPRGPGPGAPRGPRAGTRARPKGPRGAGAGPAGPGPGAGGTHEGL